MDSLGNMSDEPGYDPHTCQPSDKNDQIDELDGLNDRTETVPPNARLRRASAAAEFRQAPTLFIQEVIMNGYGKRVLIVVNGQTEWDLLSLRLEEAGYSVYVALDGRQALKEMKRRHFDVVVTDYHMPRINGISLVLLARLVWPEIPMVLLSGGDASLAEIAKQEGAHVSLCQPYDSDELVKLLDKAIQSDRECPIQTRTSVPPSSG
jgi:two-component system chemotaxis response regulator CheY